MRSIGSKQGRKEFVQCVSGTTSSNERKGGRGSYRPLCRFSREGVWVDCLHSREETSSLTIPERLARASIFAAPSLEHFPVLHHALHFPHSITIPATTFSALPINRSSLDRVCHANLGAPALLITAPGLFPVSVMCRRRPMPANYA